MFKIMNAALLTSQCGKCKIPSAYIDYVGGIKIVNQVQSLHRMIQSLYHQLVDLH